MRGRARAAAILLSLSAAVGACSLFVDTSDLTGGSSDPNEGGLSDAGGDSVSPDGSGPNDAAIDAPFVFSCDATLCESFDLQGKVPGNWDVHADSDGGTVGVVAEGRSLPNALAAAAPILVKGTRFAIGTSFTGTAPTFRLEADMFLDPNDGSLGSEVDLFDVIVNGSDPAEYSLYVGAFDDEWSIAEYATFSDGGKVDRHVPLTLDPPTGRWTHVLFVGDGSSITVSFDGNPDGTLTGLASFAAATGVKRTVDVGFPYIENTKQPLRVRFDDIAFTP